jgi:hypothetical protein
MFVRQSRSIRIGTLLLTAAAAIACAAPSAQAVFPGKPGKIVFSMSVSGEDADVLSVDPGTGESVKVIPSLAAEAWEGNEVEPAWSPSGRLIAFKRVENPFFSTPTQPRAPSDVYVMGPDGGAERDVRADGTEWGGDGSLCGQAHYGTPDFPYPQPPPGCIPVEPPSTNHPQRTYKQVQALRRGPEWSPDRRSRLVLGYQGRDLFVGTAGDRILRRVTFTPDEYELGYTFSPDGAAVAFVYIVAGQEADRSGIKLVDLRTGQGRTLIEGERIGLSAPSWGPLPVPCKGKRSTLVGTEGRDILVGTKGNDVIAGLAGKDLIKGRGGRDRVCGGPGRDRVIP